MSVNELIALGTAVGGSLGGFLGFLGGRKKEKVSLINSYQEMYQTFVDDQKQAYTEMKQYFEKKINHLEKELELCRKKHLK